MSVKCVGAFQGLCDDTSKGYSVKVYSLGFSVCDILIAKVHNYFKEDLEKDGLVFNSETMLEYGDDSRQFYLDSYGNRKLSDSDYLDELLEDVRLSE